MWVFNVKRKSDGIIERCKAHLVVKGFNQCYGLDYEDTFSLILKISVVHLVHLLLYSRYGICDSWMCRLSS